MTIPHGIPTPHPNTIDRPLTGRLALVTGGSRGVGRAICDELARHGANVAFTYQRDSAAAERTLELVINSGVQGMAVLASVDSPVDNLETVQAITERLGEIDILINNAGVVSSGRQVIDTPTEETERILRIHALGPMQLCQLVLPAMRRKKRGDIVFISSVATTTFMPRAAPYTMAKCAAEALAATLAKEEARHHVRVNIVAPGLIDTDMGRRLMAARSGDSAEFGECSTPEEVARLVHDVISDQDVSATGHRFAIEGGALVP